MDVDDSVEPPQGLNLTACLVLNQRDDERLGFDFVSFPGDNEVLGVVDLTPGAHFIYVKKEEYNDEIDMRLGEFVYVPPDTCTVLKRRRDDDDGALFEVVEPEEARSYHSSLVAGHFSNKLAKVPQQLRELWFNLTEFITEDVMRALRPLYRKVSSKSKYSARVEPADSFQPISQGNWHDNVEGISQKDQSNPVMRWEVPPIGIGSPSDKTVENHNTDIGDVNGNMEIESHNVQTITEANNVEAMRVAGEGSEVMSNKRECPFVAFNTQDEDETVEDYMEIAKHFKGMKNRTGLICETLRSSKGIVHGTGPVVEKKSYETNRPSCGVKLTAADAMACSKVSPDCISKEVIQTETVLDSELAADQCTVYYSDLRRINRKMTLLSTMTPANVTKMHLDTTHILDAIAANHRRFKASSHGTGNPIHRSEEAIPTDMKNSNSSSSYGDVLGEYQYAFCLFLLNFHYDSFEHWKAMFRAICGAEAFFIGNPEFAEKVLNVMRLQLETFESDLYEPDNFFAYYLSSLEEIITDNQEQLSVLREPFEHIRNTFKLKFGISLEDAKILQDNVQIVDEHGN